MTNNNRGSFCPTGFTFTMGVLADLLNKSSLQRNRLEIMVEKIPFYEKSFIIFLNLIS